MNPVQRAIAAARRRIVAQHWLTATGWALLGGVALAGALVLLERLLATPIPFVSYYVLAGLAVLIPPVSAMLRRPTIPRAAVLVDERLKLKDRIATSLYAASLTDDPFAQQVVSDAARSATGLRVTQVFPIRLAKVWGYVPPAALVVALLAWMLEPMDLAGFAAARRRAAMQQAQAAAQREELAKVVQAVHRVEVKKDAAGTDESLEALQELASLTERDLTDPKMRRDAAAKLSRVQEQLAAVQQRKEAEFRPIQNAMSQLDPATTGPADEFADALRRADFQAALQALQKLTDQVDQLSPEDKQALQQQLEQLAQQLEQAAQQQQAQQQQAQQQLQQMAQQAGLSQQQTQQFQSGQMSQQQLQQTIQQNLQQQGVPPQQAQQQSQQMAQQMQQQQQQCQSSGQCQNTSQGLSQSMSQMAQSLSQQQQASQGQQGQQGQGQQPSQQFAPSAHGAQQQLDQLAQMQQQMQQMQQAQQQAQQSMQQMAQGGGQPGQGQGQGVPGQGGGVGGSKAGTGSGGNPLGGHSQMTGHTTTEQRENNDAQGRVIATWLSQGEVAKGEPTVEFNTAITQAQQSAEQAVADDRVPRRFHSTIKNYFDQLPATPEEVTKPSGAPAAPR